MKKTRTEINQMMAAILEFVVMDYCTNDALVPLIVHQVQNKNLMWRFFLEGGDTHFANGIVRFCMPAAVRNDRLTSRGWQAYFATAYLGGWLDPVMGMACADSMALATCLAVLRAYGMEVEVDEETGEPGSERTTAGRDKPAGAGDGAGTGG